MIKFFVSSLIFFIFVSFFSLSQASPITNLTAQNLIDRDYTNAEDQLSANLLGVNYITYKGYDWAWASYVNVENFDVNNTLYAPQLQKNWGFATGDLFNVLINDLTIDDFKKSTGEYIHAAQFFNSDFHEVNTQFTEFIFSESMVRSEWYGGDYSEERAQYNTFYVRPSQVPEPSTLMIFALGLIALVSKKRLFS